MCPILAESSQVLLEIWGDLGTPHATHHLTFLSFHFRSGFDGADGAAQRPLQAFEETRLSQGTSGAFMLSEQFGLLGTDALAEEISP